MYTNQKPSEGLGLLGNIDPASQAAGTVTTGWVDQSGYFAMLGRKRHQLANAVKTRRLLLGCGGNLCLFLVPWPNHSCK